MEKNIDRLIVRVLNSEASPEEILQFSAWLNADAKNEKEFCRIKSYWQAEVVTEELAEPLTALRNLTELIEKKTQKKNKYILFSLSAAAVIGLLLVSLSMNYFSREGTGDIIEYYTYLTGSDKSEVALEDGTKIVLNKNSRLTYNNQYGDRERVVQLIGEAYFEVAKDTLSPFILNLGESSIRVLGTKFNAKSFKGNSDVVATLIEGSIQFQNAEQKVLLYPDQQLRYDSSTGKINIKPVTSTDYMAWTDNVLKYKSIAFVNLVKELSEVYKTRIVIRNEKLKGTELAVSASFEENQTLDDVLRVISRSLPIRWEKKEGIYYIQ